MPKISGYHCKICAGIKQECAVTKCKLCSSICNFTGKSCHDNTIHTHVHTHSQHNILAINIKSKQGTCSAVMYMFQK